jgi:hypothetical protein
MFCISNSRAGGGKLVPFLDSAGQIYPETGLTFEAPKCVLTSVICVIHHGLFAYITDYLRTTSRIICVLRHGLSVYYITDYLCTTTRIICVLHHGLSVYYTTDYLCTILRIILCTSRNMCTTSQIICLHNGYLCSTSRIILVLSHGLYHLQFCYQS